MSADCSDELRATLALLLLPGIGPQRFRQLRERYGSACAALALARHESGLNETLRTALQQPDWAAVDRILAWGEQPDHHLILQDSPLYPPRLRAIADAPPLLYLRGRIEALCEPQLSIVGSRNPSHQGNETAFDFARRLAALGIAITSGLALGIDAAAHRGALAAHGTTLAIFGTGLDRVYPLSHRNLAHQIVAEGGALIAELPPDCGPLAHNFPRRNRIISGLSLGILVVEAALKSGSLITARLAAEQGREVFAVPGSIYHPLARGCHQLIRQGARLVETPQEILEDLAPQLKPLLNLPPLCETETAPAPAADLDADYQRLLNAIDDQPTAIDQIVLRSQLTPDAVSSMLLILELQGHVVAGGGGYQRTRTRT
jgi:DNA processing protein